MTSAARDSIATTAINVARLNAIRFTRKTVEAAVSAAMARATRPPLQQDRQSLLRRASRRGYGCRRGEIELHRRRFFRARLGVKERPRRKAKHAGKQLRRERHHGSVIALHRFVEFIALDRDSILRPFELRLQAEEILVRAQFRVTFAHD